jgi:Zn-dependent protease with chaperone function
MISAQYFDGISTRLHAVHLVPDGATLHVSGDDISRTVPMADIRVREPFANAPCILQLPDGAHCAVHQGAGRSALLAALAYRPGRVERMQRYWKGALAGLVAIAGFLVFSYLVLLPMLTDRIAERLPQTMMVSIGDQAEQIMQDRGMLEFSLRQWRHHEALQQAFLRVQPANPALALRVKLRSGSIGANAIALPNGTIIVTDSMISLVASGPSMSDTKSSPDEPWHFKPEVEERLAAIMAHEIAHLERRHSARKLVRATLSGAASWALLGDISGVLSAAPVVFSQAHFSREMESEADARAMEILRANGIPVTRLAEVFEQMQANQARIRTNIMAKNKTGQAPQWLKTGFGYLASHPAPAERVARIRALHR